MAFTLMRKRINGPLHYSLFEQQPDSGIENSSRLERLYRCLDNDLNEIQKNLADGPGTNAGRYAA